MTRRKSIPAKPNPGEPKPAHVKREALRLRRSGMVATQIAAKLRRQFGIKLAKATVQLWGDEADAEQAPVARTEQAPAGDAPAVARQGTALAPDWETAGPPTPRLVDASYGQPEPSALPVETALDIDADPTGIATLRALVREHRALAAMARRDGNAAAAAKALKAASDAANTIARLEAGSPADGEGALVMTKDQVAAVRAQARQLEAKYASDLARLNGPCCAECGRRLRLELASRPGEPTVTH